jgi:hypothetical protein
MHLTDMEDLDAFLDADLDSYLDVILDWHCLLALVRVPCERP